MLFHLGWLLPKSFGPVSRFGWMGVDLFFVLSGYLIGSQLLKPYLAGERPSIAGFYRRRIYRILPAYLFVLSLYALLPVWREEDGISPLWQFLTFTENLFVDYSIHQAFSHVWSLCVEEHFYLLLPLLVLSMMRKPSLWKTMTLLVSVVLLGIFLRAYVLVQELQPLGADNAGVKYIEHIYYPTYTHLDGLLAGVTLALIKIFRPAWWAAAARKVTPRSSRASSYWAYPYGSSKTVSSRSPASPRGVRSSVFRSCLSASVYSSLPPSARMAC